MQLISTQWHRFWQLCCKLGVVYLVRSHNHLILSYHWKLAYKAYIGFFTIVGLIANNMERINIRKRNTIINTECYDNFNIILFLFLLTKQLSFPLTVMTSVLNISNVPLFDIIYTFIDRALARKKKILCFAWIGK